MTDIKAGDVVRLRSGGPRMTVLERKGQDNGWVECQWFDSKQTLQAHGFVIDVLRRVDDDGDDIEPV